MKNTDSFYTYLWLRDDGTPYYVGKGSGRRAFRRGAPPSERVLIQEHPSERDAFVAEIFLIAYYGRKDLGTGCLINLKDGGQGGSNPSEETREKMSSARAGKKLGPLSAEHKEKLSAIGKRRVCSDETRAKLSAAGKRRKKKPFSTEHREKLSLAQKGKNKKPFSDEHRANLSAAKKGKKKKPFSDEHRANLSSSRIGKHHSEETIEKISAARKRYIDKRLSV